MKRIWVALLLAASIAGAAPYRPVFGHHHHMPGPWLRPEPVRVVVVEWPWFLRFFMLL
jgi:hypothetical protein